MGEIKSGDGRRLMPKSWCPYCRSRVVDSRTIELRNSIELLPLSSPEAEHFIICPKCHKTVGVRFKIPIAEPQRITAGTH